MPPPLGAPIVDPNSELGRRLLAQQGPPLPGGVAFGGAGLGGRDTSEAAVQAELRRQHEAAMAAPAAAPAANPFRDGTGQASPTPADLAGGNTPVAPVQTLDPFRVLPARQAADRRLADGSVLPGEFFGPGMAGMTTGGFQPGLMQIGGMTTSAADPAAYLMGVQQQARINGVSPNLTLESLLGTMNNSADRSGRAGVEAQKGNVNLATGRMQADAHRDAARTSAEGAAEAAAFAAIPGLAQGAATMPAALVQSLGDILDRRLSRPPGGGYGGPMGPGGPAPAPGGTSAPGGPPGDPGGPTPGPRPGGAGAALAAAAAGAEFLRPLQATFGTRNAQGVVQRPEGYNPTAAVNQLLDRLHTASPEQRAMAIQAIERGDLGDANEVLTAIGRRGGVATARTMGGTGPDQTRAGNLLSMVGLGPNMPFLGSAAPKPHVIMGPDGRPHMTLRANPNQNAIAASLGVIRSAGVGPNQVLYPGFDPIDFDRSDVSSPFNGPGATPDLDRRHAATAMDVIRMTNRYRAAAGR